MERPRFGAPPLCGVELWLVPATLKRTSEDWNKEDAMNAYPRRVGADWNMYLLMKPLLALGESSWLSTSTICVALEGSIVYRNSVCMLLFVAIATATPIRNPAIVSSTK